MFVCVCVRVCVHVCVCVCVCVMLSNHRLPHSPITTRDTYIAVSRRRVSTPPTPVTYTHKSFSVALTSHENNVHDSPSPCHNPSPPAAQVSPPLSLSVSLSCALSVSRSFSLSVCRARETGSFSFIPSSFHLALSAQSPHGN